VKGLIKGFVKIKARYVCWGSPLSLTLLNLKKNKNSWLKKAQFYLLEAALD